METQFCMECKNTHFGSQSKTFCDCSCHFPPQSKSMKEMEKIWRCISHEGNEEIVCPNCHIWEKALSSPQL